MVVNILRSSIFAPTHTHTHNLMNKFLLTTLILSLNLTFMNAQVGIGTTNPSASSALDINSDKAGLLIPRVSLTSTTDVSTIANPATSLLVYNMATISDIVPGFYYWNNRWILFQDSSTANDWKTSGNAITAGNFLGTTNNQDLILKMNNANVAKFDKSNSVTLGSNSNITPGISNSMILGNSAAVSSPNSVAIGNQTAVSGQFATAIGYQSTTSQDYAVVLGTTSTNSKVGIGTSAPDEKLHVVGNIKMVDGKQGDGNILRSDANGKATWETIDDLIVRLNPQLVKYGELFRTANTTINAGNQVPFDTNGPFSGVTLNTSNIRVNTAGDYKITFTVNVQRGTSVGNHVFHIRKNGVKINGSTSYSSLNNSFQGTVTKTKVVTLAANDVITVYYESGDSLALLEGSTLLVEFIK